MWWWCSTVLASPPWSPTSWCPASCVEHVVPLHPSSSLQSLGWTALQSLFSRPDLRLVVVTQTTDQLKDLFLSLLDLLGWDKVTQAEYLAWSYLQTDNLLADLANLLAVTEQEIQTSPQAVAGKMARARDGR